ncbi:MAG: cyanophycinase [Rhodospirillaceae bacterium]|nr:cyanophycinase [Rhodospirillaceae bacterium]
MEPGLTMNRQLAAAVLAAVILFSGAASSQSNDKDPVIPAGGAVSELAASQMPAVTPIHRPTGRGTLVLEGGGPAVDAASELTVALAGPQPTLCLIDTATGGKGDPSVKFSKIGGVRMLTLDVTRGNAGDARIVEALQRCTGYYFDGGNPKLLSESFITRGGDSPALRVIRDRYEHAGAVVAGISAGAMIAGPITLCECDQKSSVAALTEGKLFMAPGFHFIEGMLIDAHFFTRGLIGRHLHGMAKTGAPIGIGIDEATAVVVPGNGELWQVIGLSSVALIRRGSPTAAGPLSGLEISMLNTGDRFNPRTGEVIVDKTRTPIRIGRDAAAGPLKMNDIFAPNRLREMIAAIVMASNTTAQGYSKAAGLMIELHKRPETAAYVNAGSITVLNLDLDVAVY